MSLHITCSECFTTTHLPANMLDRKVRCRHCRVIFLVRDVLDDDEPVLTAHAGPGPF